MVHEVAQTQPLEEGDAPAILVVVSAPAALGETREAEGHVGWRVAVHPKQLAHGLIVLSPSAPRHESTELLRIQFSSSDV